MVLLAEDRSCSYLSRAYDLRQHQEHFNICILTSSAKALTQCLVSYHTVPSFLVR